MPSVLSSLFNVGTPYPSAPPQGVAITQQKLAEEVSPFYKDLLQKSQSLHKERSDEGYMPYTGPTIADWSPEQQQAFTGISGLVGTQAPVFDEATALTRGTTAQFTPEKAQELMSPYQQAVTDVELRKAQERYEGQTLPGLQAQAAQIQPFGGSRQAIVEGMAAQNQAQLLADIQARGSLASYQDAQRIFEDQIQREGTAASQLATLGQAGYKAQAGELGAMQAIGEEKQKMSQAALDDAYRQFLEEKRYPEDILGQYQATVQGFPALRQEIQRTAPPPQPSLANQLIGGLGTIGSLYGAYGGFTPQGFGSSLPGYGPVNRPAKTGGGLQDIIHQAHGSKDNLAYTSFMNRPSEEDRVEDITIPDYGKNYEQRSEYENKVLALEDLLNKKTEESDELVDLLNTKSNREYGSSINPLAMPPLAQTFYKMMSDTGQEKEPETLQNKWSSIHGLSAGGGLGSLPMVHRMFGGRGIAHPGDSNIHIGDKGIISGGIGDVIRQARAAGFFPTQTQTSTPVTQNFVATQKSETPSSLEALNADILSRNGEGALFTYNNQNYQASYEGPTPVNNMTAAGGGPIIARKEGGLVSLPIIKRQATGATRVTTIGGHDLTNLQATEAQNIFNSLNTTDKELWIANDWHKDFNTHLRLKDIGNNRGIVFNAIGRLSKTFRDKIASHFPNMNFKNIDKIPLTEKGWEARFREITLGEAPLYESGFTAEDIENMPEKDKKALTSPSLASIYEIGKKFSLAGTSNVIDYFNKDNRLKTSITSEIPELDKEAKLEVADTERSNYDLSKNILDEYNLAGTLGKSSDYEKRIIDAFAASKNANEKVREAIRKQDKKITTRINAAPEAIRSEIFARMAQGFAAMATSPSPPVQAFLEQVPGFVEDTTATGKEYRERVEDLEDMNVESRRAEAELNRDDLTSAVTLGAYELDKQKIISDQIIAQYAAGTDAEKRAISLIRSIAPWLTSVLDGKTVAHLIDSYKVGGYQKMAEAIDNLSPAMIEKLPPDWKKIVGLEE